jgi:hypothetical protein
MTKHEGESQELGVHEERSAASTTWHERGCQQKGIQRLRAGHGVKRAIHYGRRPTNDHNSKALGFDLFEFFFFDAVDLSGFYPRLPELSESSHPRLTRHY